jgi:hypothetical protein
LYTVSRKGAIEKLAKKEMKDALIEEFVEINKKSQMSKPKGIWKIV